MNLGLYKSVVLLLGAGNGLGRNICVEFAKEKAIVCGIARKKESLESCQTEIKKTNSKSCGMFFQGDACNPFFLKDCIEKINNCFGHINIGVCNIGPTVGGDWDQLTEEDWIGSLRQNVYPFYFMCKELASSMKEQKDGSIIQIGSVSTIRPGGISKPDHAFFKAGAYTLMRRLSKELAEYNIRINMVSPGLIDPLLDKNNNVSKMLCKRLKVNDIKEAITLYSIQKIPLKRSANPNEIAKMIVFVSSPASSYLTGQNIILDGGYSI